jgi:DNA processing protein
MISTIAFFRFFQSKNLWSKYSSSKNWLLGKISSDPGFYKQDLFDLFLAEFKLPRSHFEKDIFQSLESVKRDFDQGINYTWYGDLNYPFHFYHLEDPPLLLSYKGKICWNGVECISIVGSRDPSPMSMQWMKTELYSFFKNLNSKVCIVSGGARGVDELSHRLALLTEHPTVLFMPSGLAKPYPAKSEDLHRQIFEAGGALVSEYDSNLSMRKLMFRHRNRLIAAMNQFLLIVEARKRSGSIMTANYSLAMGKLVGVIPGHPLQSAFEGGLEILINGGLMIRNQEDLEFYIQESQKLVASGSDRVRDLI